MNKFKFLKKVWSIAKQHRWYFFLSYIILLIELAFNQILPLLLGNLVDAAVYKTNIRLFMTSAGIYATVFLGSVLCGFLQLQFWQKLNNKYVYGLRVRCYEKILRLKARTLTDIKTGDMLQTINGDTMEFHHIIQRYAMRVVNAGIGTVVSLAIVAYLKWEIALIIAILIPTSILLTERIKNKTNEIFNEIREKQGQYNSWLMEILKGIREIKLFAAEDNTQHKFTDKNNDLIKSSVKSIKIGFASDKTIGLIYFVAQLIFYIVSALFVVNGSINVAEYITIAAYYTLVSSNFQRILRDNMAFQARQVAIERVFMLLDKEYEDNAGLSSLTVSQGKIEIEDLSFAYQEDVDVLKNLTYTITPGKRIGIVGASGVGKSTFAHMMIRFFTPTKGKIMIDGQDLNACTYSSVRENIGLVGQETVIFDATVKDNICFGADVPDEAIWGVLKKAYLKNEIEKLPEGLHTMLGKDGQSLSGGQNQRLAIARILFKNPKIVILDEATSALDEAAEQIVQNALDELTAGRTSIVISHRLNNILHADEIIVLKDGEVAATGKYEDLIRTDTTFSELFAAQAKKLEAIG
ncbi:MAG: ABC transporter ATP-binding protein [Oscillospiraceae bacterium]|nr:ABC transporter ATP-binding protein [Oscillospiraceae bacterium]